MQNISPHARSEAERARNRRAHAIIAATLAVVVCGGLWVYGNPASPSVNNENSTGKHASAPKSKSAETTRPEHAAVSAEQDMHWKKQVTSLQLQLPAQPITVSSRVHQQLDELAQHLETHHPSLPADSEFGIKIEQELATVRQQVEMLRVQSAAPTVNAGDFESQIKAEADALLANEQEETQNIVQAAAQLVRTEREPELRRARLELRDQIEQAAKLSEQINKELRTQTKIRDKAARAQALQLVMGDVRAYLSPFTSPGHLQPNSTTLATNTIKTADAMPVSLSRLTKLGALEPTMKGLDNLYQFGGSKDINYLNNTRPLASFPPYIPTSLGRNTDTLAKVKRAQQLIREHGQALVEAGLLSP